MKTLLLTVDNCVNNSEIYSQAVDYLNRGELVAFPTETVYGLGAVATDESAIRKIFEAKDRPSDNPLIVHIGNVEEIPTYIEYIPEVAKKCMEKFWPGPLTIVMKAKDGVVAPSVTAGLNTVGIRMPDHPVALTLLRTLKKPLAAPSANRSGKPSPTKAFHVKEDMDGRIPCIIDGGTTGIGLESTVLDVTTETPVILRPGGVTKEMLEEVIGRVAQPTLQEQKEEKTPKAPGMKYTHYAPEAPVYLIDDSTNLYEAIARLQAEGHTVALLAPDGYEQCGANYFFTLGDENEQQQMGVYLYDALRACDKTDATIILARATYKKGVGVAIMNRLEKAAGDKWYNNKK
ncbi:L-threonylcarbamoyladenylate synthase [Lysinibacillus sp. 54212]|uniref:L-threonylcarbamoyladenylate synthase n=1 Tax=Lysinibacillus sp. 54212 TaxID=3119829 RepID=UPI002FC633DB